MLRTIGVAFVSCLMSCVCGAQQAQQTSTFCQFTKGPAAGTIHNYAPLAPGPVGSHCFDNKGSTGYLIPPPADNPQAPLQLADNASPAKPQPASPASIQPGAQPSIQATSPSSTLCSFTSGPAAGTTRDYAPLDPLPVGTSCNDGMGSTGTMIARSQAPPPPTAVPATSSAQQTSTLCSFNQGPAAGTTHDYAPLDPLPVGSPCNNGKGSTGTVIARSPNPPAAAVTYASMSQQTSTLCSFSQGPASGTTHDYAPLDPLPLGTACNDGRGSTGTIIARPPEPSPNTASTAAGSHETSTLCKFNAGPLTGTTRDYAPLDPLPVGTECNDGAGSTGVIIAHAATPPPPANTPSYSGPGPASTNPATISTTLPSYAGTGAPQLSTVCKFTSGPAAGNLHDYAPLQPIPVGSACNDGKGSTGIIIPRSQSQP